MPSAKKPYAKRNTKKPTTKVSKATKTYVKKALETDKEPQWALIDNSLQALYYDAPLLAQWSSISQGSTINTREGDRISPTSLEMRYQIALGPQLDVVARIILFQWKPDTAVDAPTATKILNIPNSSDSIFSPYVKSAVLRKKFHILSDKIHYNTTATSNQVLYEKTNISKFSGKYINYAPGATTGKNNIFVLALSNYINGSVNAPVFDKIVYLNWKDSQ